MLPPFYQMYLAFQSAQTILADAADSAQQASAVSDKVDRLTSDLDQTEMTLSGAEQQAEADQAAVQQVGCP